MAVMWRNGSSFGGTYSVMFDPLSPAQTGAASEKMDAKVAKETIVDLNIVMKSVGRCTVDV